MWSRIRIAAVALLLYPVSGSACEWADRFKCMDEVGQLVNYRSEAIEYAFGDVFGALPGSLEIRFVRNDDERYASYAGRIAYDVNEHALIVPQRFMHARLPQPMRWAAAYWPYYDDTRYQQLFPLIADIDNALWGAVLQENARAAGHPWPHEQCASMELAQRLPCQMLVSGIAALLTERQTPLFNANRLERIWPEHFSSFEQRSWRSDRDYNDVQYYGGIMLLRPLFGELGVPQTLAYVARTPFKVENDNMHESALRYQREAREFQLPEPPPANAVQTQNALPDPPPVRDNASFIRLGLSDKTAQ
ncbi:MAG TPA: hypothetical protein VFR96_04380 [Povalibacter sp.]|nr:hypothetical protein [Povalibacter sp.]